MNVSSDPNTSKGNSAIKAQSDKLKHQALAPASRANLRPATGAATSFVSASTWKARPSISGCRSVCSARFVFASRRPGKLVAKQLGNYSCDEVVLILKPLMLSPRFCARSARLVQSNMCGDVGVTDLVKR